MVAPESFERGGAKPREHARGDRIKILYVGGSGRSGSTLLSLLMGQIGGAFNAGESHYLWDWGLLENRLCGCGSSFQDCEFWQRVLQCAYVGEIEAVGDRTLRLRHKIARTRHLAQLLAIPGRPLGMRRALALAAAIRPLYQGIAEITSCRFIVDASKFPAYAFILSLIPEVDLHLLHLTRDPRAVGYSWLRHRINPDSGRPFGRRGIVKSSMLWVVENLATESVGRRLGRERYLRLRYEDLVRDPTASMDSVLKLLREPEASFDLRDRQVKIEAGHTIAGNPVRFSLRPQELKEDVEWKAELPTASRLMSTALCLPLLRRLGYR